MAINGTANGHTVSGLVKFEELGSNIKSLLRKAVEAREFAYAPYSKFKVGACVELEDGSTVTGCNVENASFTVGICAERCALVKAISEGKLKYKRIAVIAHQERGLTSPCGACRQFMSEFGDFEVYLAKPELLDVMHTSVRQLLPHSFEVNSDYSF